MTSHPAHSPDSDSNATIVPPDVLRLDGDDQEKMGAKLASQELEPDDALWEGHAYSSLSPPPSDVSSFDFETDRLDVSGDLRVTPEREETPTPIELQDVLDPDFLSQTLKCLDNMLAAVGIPPILPFLAVDGNKPSSVSPPSLALTPQMIRSAEDPSDLSLSTKALLEVDLFGEGASTRGQADQPRRYEFKSYPRMLSLRRNRRKQPKYPFEVDGESSGSSSEDAESVHADSMIVVDSDDDSDWVPDTPEIAGPSFSQAAFVNTQGSAAIPVVIQPSTIVPLKRRRGPARQRPLQITAPNVSPARAWRAVIKPRATEAVAATQLFPQESVMRIDASGVMVPARRGPGRPRKHPSVTVPPGDVPPIQQPVVQNSAQYAQPLAVSASQNQTTFVESVRAPPLQPEMPGEIRFHHVQLDIAPTQLEPVKRKPGRPRKQPIVQSPIPPVPQPYPTPLSSASSTVVPVKRRPGRPPKHPRVPVPLPPTAQANPASSASTSHNIPTKRRSGRPRKHPLVPVSRSAAVQLHQTQLSAYTHHIIPVKRGRPLDHPPAVAAPVALPVTYPLRFPPSAQSSTVPAKRSPGRPRKYPPSRTGAWRPTQQQQQKSLPSQPTASIVPTKGAPDSPREATPPAPAPVPPPEMTLADSDDEDLVEAILQPSSDGEATYPASVLSLFRPRDPGPRPSSVLSNKDDRGNVPTIQDRVVHDNSGAPDEPKKVATNLPKPAAERHNIPPIKVNSVVPDAVIGIVPVTSARLPPGNPNKTLSLDANSTPVREGISTVPAKRTRSALSKPTTNPSIETQVPAPVKAVPSPFPGLPVARMEPLNKKQRPPRPAPLPGIPVAHMEPLNKRQKVSELEKFGQDLTAAAKSTRKLDIVRQSDLHCQLQILEGGEQRPSRKDLKHSGVEAAIRLFLTLRPEDFSNWDVWRLQARVGRLIA